MGGQTWFSQCMRGFADVSVMHVIKHINSSKHTKPIFTEYAWLCRCVCNPTHLLPLNFQSAWLRGCKRAHMNPCASPAFISIVCIYHTSTAIVCSFVGRHDRTLNPNVNKHDSMQLSSYPKPFSSNLHRLCMLFGGQAWPNAGPAYWVDLGSWRAFRSAVCRP